MYRWKVNPGQEEVFTAAWTHGTKIIRATVKGARGSLLLQSHTDPCIFVATARWASIEDWRTFLQRRHCTRTEERSFVRR
ncbi:MAG: antibiotic biosynthesis monooxygenase [Candidatus Binatia bacterium]